MNRFDKDIYKALNYFSNNELVEINKLRKNDPQIYKKRVPKHIETHIFENKYTFRIWYQHTEKTLTNKEVEVVRKKLIANLRSNFGAIFAN